MLTLSLDLELEKKLAERAVAAGQSVETFASKMLADAISAPTLDEILEPVRKRFAESGMSEEALSDLLEAEKHAMRDERRSRRVL